MGALFATEVSGESTKGTLRISTFICSGSYNTGMQAYGNSCSVEVSDCLFKGPYHSRKGWSSINHFNTEGCAGTGLLAEEGAKSTVQRCKLVGHKGWALCCDHATTQVIRCHTACNEAGAYLLQEGGTLNLSKCSS